MTRSIQMTSVDLIHANDLLKQHLKVLSPGHVEYAEGWSDDVVAQKVAEASGRDYNKHHIASLRKKVHGQLQDLNKVNPVANAHNRLNALEDRVKALESQLAELRQGKLWGDGAEKVSHHPVLSKLIAGE